MFRARSGTLEVNGRRREVNKQICSYCGIEKETMEHVIIECGKYERHREMLDKQIGDIIGMEEWKERKKWEDRGMKTILGLEGDGEEEKIVSHLKTFLINI